MWKARERRGKGGGGIWAFFYLAGMQDASLQYHSISPEWLISCGVAAQRRKRKKKLPISTGMLGHLMLYLIAGLYNSVKSGPKAVCSVSSLMFALNSDITAALQEVSPHRGSGGNYGSFSQNGSGYIILQQWKVNRAKPNQTARNGLDASVNGGRGYFIRVLYFK